MSDQGDVRQSGDVHPQRGRTVNTGEDLRTIDVAGAISHGFADIEVETDEQRHRELTSQIESKQKELQRLTDTIKKRDYEYRMLEEDLKKVTQDRQSRLRITYLLSGLTIAWLGFIIMFVWIEGGHVSRGNDFLTDPVLMALIGSTTLNVLGLFHFVLRYLFDGKSAVLLSSLKPVLPPGEQSRSDEPPHSN